MGLGMRASPPPCNAMCLCLCERIDFHCGMMILCECQVRGEHPLYSKHDKYYSNGARRIHNGIEQQQHNNDNNKIIMAPRSRRRRRRSYEVSSYIVSQRQGPGSHAWECSNKCIKYRKYISNVIHIFIHCGLYRDDEMVVIYIIIIVIIIVRLLWGNR